MFKSNKTRKKCQVFREERNIIVTKEFSNNEIYAGKNFPTEAL